MRIPSLPARVAARIRRRLAAEDRLELYLKAFLASAGSSLAGAAILVCPATPRLLADLAFLVFVCAYTAAIPLAFLVHREIRRRRAR